MKNEPNLPEGWKIKNGQDDTKLPEGWKCKTIQDDPSIPEGWKDKFPSNLQNIKRLRPNLN